MTEQYTTKLQFMNPDAPVLDGTERYPVRGDYREKVPNKYFDLIQEHFKGLTRHWDCIEKATAARSVLGGTMTVGSLYIWNSDRQSNYGHAFNPPLEFHAWLSFAKNVIIDFALPGVIEAALTARDAQGPLVKNREPFILIGRPPDWCEYTVSQYFI